MSKLQRFANSRNLPTLPEIALKMVEIAQQDDPDYAEVSQIIRSDPAVSGKVLKTVNSALFAFRQRIDSIEQAVPKLGISLLRTIILGFHLARYKSRRSELESAMAAFWRNSLTQAVLAEMVAEQIEGADPPTYFLAGMLQDIGILAMLAEAPTDYQDHVLERAELPNVTAAEQKYFGFSHVELSLEILKRWGLANVFGEPVRHHHDRIAPPVNSQTNKLTLALQAANLGATVLASTRTSAISLDDAIEQWSNYLNTYFGLTTVKAEEMLTDVSQRVGEYSTLFAFNIDDGVQVEDVIQRAKDMLQEIALKNQLELISLKKSAGQRSEDDELYWDSLSRLRNRRFLDEFLSQRVERSVKRKTPIAFLFLDVDKFKAINDTYGHATGDQVIQHISRWLECSIRKNDMAIRVGGDEFLVVLEQVDEKQFEKIAARIAGEIPPFSTTDGEPIKISLSVGCVYYQPVRGDVVDVNWLIDRSDQSMYKAKREGGNGIAMEKFVGVG